MGCGRKGRPSLRVEAEVGVSPMLEAEVDLLVVVSLDGEDEDGPKPVKVEIDIQLAFYYEVFCIECVSQRYADQTKKIQCVESHITRV